MNTYINVDFPSMIKVGVIMLILFPVGCSLYVLGIIKKSLQKELISVAAESGVTHMLTNK